MAQPTQNLEVCQAVLLPRPEHLKWDHSRHWLGAHELAHPPMIESGCQEPQSLLAEQPKMPGLDGEKMSKSYNNYISLREAPDSVEQKIRTMQTDPARVRKTDPGDPEQCPVYALHQVYSDKATLEWAAQGCRSAAMGCIDCKGPLIDSVNAEQEIIRQRAQQFDEDADLVNTIIQEGSEKARSIARETLDDVREAIGISHR